MPRTNAGHARMNMIHHFQTTGEAYDACQCDETITSGDVLVILPEGVVGIADTWPVAVTLNHGNLHHPRPGISLAQCLAERDSAIGITPAKAEALRLNLEVRP